LEASRPFGGANGYVVQSSLPSVLVEFLDLRVALINNAPLGLYADQLKK